MTESLVSVYEAIRRRRDVRAEFSGELIPDETLQRVLGAAHAAPSVGNTQPWDFIVVRNQDTLDTFAEHVAGRRRAFADSL
ncbi:5,6-dimethylbenzimidazole synthase, partial [Rhodococcus hoagii]|nr:5,6-dimethylbenzimidazole synthase [Prescottella equi]